MRRDEMSRKRRASAYGLACDAIGEPREKKTKIDLSPPILILTKIRPRILLNLTISVVLVVVLAS